MHHSSSSETAIQTAFVVPYRFVPPTNGGQQAAYGLATALQGRRPLLCLTTAQGSGAAPSFPWVRVLPDGVHKYVSPVVAWRVWRVLRRQGIRTCLIHQPFMGLMLWPLCRWGGMRLVVYVQNVEYQRFRSMGRWWWPVVYAVERWVSRRADHLFFISPDDLPEAVRAFGLQPGRCTALPYGIWQEAMPTDRAAAREVVCQRHGFDPAERLLIFFGPQSYAPNLVAVEAIVQEIAPRLRQQAPGLRWRILICGGGLPAKYNRFAHLQGQGISYLGFVEDIETYVKAADLMLNPVDTGGGVKTKLIEAIGWGTPVVSSHTGAKGVDASLCGPQLTLLPDGGYDAWPAAIAQRLAAPASETPEGFYARHYWGAVGGEAVQALLPD